VHHCRAGTLLDAQLENIAVSAHSKIIMSFAAITALTDSLCAKPLNAEYRPAIHHVMDARVFRGGSSF